MTAGVFDNTRPADSFFYSTLNNCFVRMVPSFFTGFLVYPPGFLWKNPLPSPFGRSIGIL